MMTMMIITIIIIIIIIICFPIIFFPGNKSSLHTINIFDVLEYQLIFLNAFKQ